uniref:Uncharacterized protein n=1 Tax=Kalmanozyma brasiliensis (strain GHG001) TaxID=1365824 RepID=V5GI26_KALBG
MASVASSSTPAFLEHIHCSVCYKSLKACSNDTATNQTGDPADEPFWIGDPSEGLQAPCPKCLVTVHVVQLQTHQLPPHVYRYVQPFDASIQEIADVYKSTSKSDFWITFSTMSTRLGRSRALEEVRKENVALKEEITVLRLPAPKTEPGTLPAQPSNGAHPLGMGIVKGQERMPPPSRSAVYQQAPPPNLRPPSRAMPAAPKADATFDDGDQIMHDSG